MEVKIEDTTKIVKVEVDEHLFNESEITGYHNLNLKPEVEHAECKLQDLHYSVDVKDEPEDVYSQSACSSEAKFYQAKQLDLSEKQRGKFCCHICDCEFKWKISLRHHFILKHTDNKPVKPYACEICDYRGLRRSHLNDHIRTHTGEKPFACDFCDYKCARKSHLKCHLGVHGLKPFVCDICNHATTRKNLLEEHIRTHTGEKPFSCEICNNYKTSNRGRLRQHMNIHTGDKPFSCKICNYATRTAGKLQRHSKTHTNKKPFVCELCDYKGARKEHLKRHSRTHTGEKPFPCQICDRKFAAKDKLNYHLKTHSNGKQSIKTESQLIHVDSDHQLENINC